MNTKQDGGPAFPIPPVGTGDPRDGMSSGSNGMSLRDWFAGQALPRAIDYAEKHNDKWETGDVEELMDSTDTAEMAYRYADAMLKAREQ